MGELARHPRRKPHPRPQRRPGACVRLRPLGRLRVRAAAAHRLLGGPSVDRLRGLRALRRRRRAGVLAVAQERGHARLCHARPLHHTAGLLRALVRHGGKPCAPPPAHPPTPRSAASVEATRPPAARPPAAHPPTHPTDRPTAAHPPPPTHLPRVSARLSSSAAQGTQSVVQAKCLSEIVSMLLDGMGEDLADVATDAAFNGTASASQVGQAYAEPGTRGAPALRIPPLCLPAAATAHWPGLLGRAVAPGCPALRTRDEQLEPPRARCGTSSAAVRPGRSPKPESRSPKPEARTSPVPQRPTGTTCSPQARARSSSRRGSPTLSSPTF